MTEYEKVRLPETKKGRKTKEAMEKFQSELVLFAETLLEINNTLHDKVSARGWCYLLEGFGAINKDQFASTQKIINRCRKEGLLPIDFVAGDKARSFLHVESLSEDYKDPKEFINRYLDFIKNIHEYKEDVAFWESQEYYVQVMVEKIDVLNLFDDVCKDYHVPIANAKGWSDLLSRYHLATRFKEAEEMGLKPVLLYYGDFDPAGIKIADTFKKNLRDIEKATNWSPENLIIDRFGLTYQFIEDNGLLWIDNLTTGTGRDLGKLFEQYKEGKKAKIMDYEIQYIEKYGAKKCEANAILPIRDIAIDNCEKAIQKTSWN